MSLLLALLLAQAGPAVTPGAAPPLPAPPVAEARVRSAAESACPDMANPVDAADMAGEWLATAKGTERAKAGECLGVALSLLDRWDDAAGAFANARVAADQPAWRARLGGMAGEAALNAGDPETALSSLNMAKSDAVNDKAMTGGLEVFRARALVALQRDGEAATALEAARAVAPDSAQAWLLSATLSRRMGKLAEAQQQIERAFDLRPVDLGIGLEAGVIAVLSGREEAARKSWQSVITAAPESDAAAQARDYLAQLGGSPTIQGEQGR